ncbi:MAG: winged helix-turn-helix transcriptional regulator [Planctomycetota bacterium]|jgi:hypothetical protein|nr:winged helix-turn-helix transcriptional regulator [Planctomycetota bacterium]
MPVNGGGAARVKPDVAMTTLSRLKGLELVERGRAILLHSLNPAQIRDREFNSERVTVYVEMLQQSEPPPIIVVMDDSGRSFIADGHHRAAACGQAGRIDIVADVYRGTALDAVLIGLEANNSGPLALTAREKSRHLDSLLREHGTLSVSAIAKIIGVSRQTVSARKKRLADNGSFIQDLRRVLPEKTREQRLEAATKVVVKQFDNYGGAPVILALARIPAYHRERIISELRNSLPDLGA